MAVARVLDFVDGQWLEVDTTAASDSLLAADSFLLRGGQAVAWGDHFARFRAACDDAGGVDPAAVEAFLDQSRWQLPSESEWFPRLEYLRPANQSRLRLRIRPAPPVYDSVILALAPQDSRTIPWRKGPDLERMSALRQEVARHGADEALIAGEDGVVIEGAYSSLLVWSQDSRQVFLTPPTYPRVASVTEKVLAGLLRDEGVDVCEKALTLDQWADHDVWVVSALHGIRVATSVINGPPLRPQRERRNRYQQAWQAQATAVSRT